MPMVARHVVTAEVTVPAHVNETMTEVLMIDRDITPHVRDEVEGSAVPSRHHYKLRDVLVETAGGGCWTEQGWILGEAAWAAPGGLPGWETLHRWRQRARIEITDPCLVFPSHENYFHWLIDFMGPFAHAWSLCEGGVQVIGDASAPAWVKSAARDLEIDVRWLDDTVVRCRDYRVTGRGRSDVHHRDAVLLRELTGTTQIPSCGRRVLLSRSRYARSTDATNRLESIAVDLGFEVLDLAGLSLTRQAQVMAEASVVVGWAGAALANIIFMNAGASVGAFGLVSASSDGRWSHFSNVAAASEVLFSPISLTDEAMLRPDLDSLVRSWLSALG